MKISGGGTAEISGLDVVICMDMEDFEPASTGALLNSLSLRPIIERLRFTPKKGRTLMLPSTESTRSVLIVGLGQRGAVNYETIRTSFSSALKALIGGENKKIGVLIPGILSAEREALEIAYISELTSYSFDVYKAEKKAAPELIRILSDSAVGTSIEDGRIMGEATNLTRHLADLPSSIGTPAFFESALRENKKVTVTALGRDDFIKLGMGGLEGVSRGAHEPPRLLIAEYGDRDMPAIMLVGKGITFDSGGISIKPSEGMQEMKFDKCGAAAVLGALKAISDMGLKAHVVGLMPLTENMPGGGSYKPGEILRHYNGVTSEVISTDAEGRLVLADALSYGIDKYKPSAVIDLATLTGACVVALGNNIAGVMGNNRELQDKIIKASGNTWERLWPLPLDDDFKDQIKSDVADIKNTGGRPGGSETAGAFLSYFVGDVPWVHLDIAGTAWKGQKTAKKDYIGLGATGFGTRLLVEFIRAGTE
ncbi:multifunctional aminopeptidase A [Thermoplasmatales archaeon]|nr:multifunctional aminopeptidase A [Thermoplasmatales archaeon]